MTLEQIASFNQTALTLRAAAAGSLDPGLLVAAATAEAIATNAQAQYNAELAYRQTLANQAAAAQANAIVTEATKARNALIKAYGEWLRNHGIDTSLMSDQAMEAKYLSMTTAPVVVPKVPVPTPGPTIETPIPGTTDTAVDLPITREQWIWIGVLGVGILYVLANMGRR